MSPGKLATMDYTRFYNIVNGEQRSSSDNHQGVNPATGEKLWDIPVATEQDLNDAVAGARAAFPSWSALTKAERDQHMADFMVAYNDNAAQLTELLCKETGKPLFWGGGEIELTKQWFNFPATTPLPDETVEDEGRTVKYSYKPLGVVGCILPWNFPVLLMAGKIASALSVGNTVVVKPSPFTPYTSTKVIELMQQFYPPGVISAVTGDDKLGPWMTQHPDIAKISFTGSTATGKKIMAACASTLKRVGLELGGNDVAIVLPDADPVLAGRELALGAFQTSGQVCIATKRIYVHSSIYQPFLAAMVELTKKLRVSSTDPQSVIGPVQNKMQYEKVQQFFADVEKQGYKVPVGGSSGVEIPKEGFFFRPTIVDNPPDDSLIVQEEPFGPIVPVQSYDSVDEAIKRANASPNGLGGSVWGTDTAEAEKVADRLETGTVWINSFSSPAANIFFPPWKQSGMGGEWGKGGMVQMCAVQVKHIWHQPVRFTETLMPPQ